MNWTIEYIAVDNYIKVTCNGTFSIEELPACFKKLFSSIYWKPDMNVLFDNRNFTFGQINLDKMRWAAIYFQQVSNQFGKGNVALLMKSVYSYGLGRQFQILSEDKLKNEIKVFIDEKAAIDWLSKDSLIFTQQESYKERRI